MRLGGSPPVANAVRFAFWGAEETGLIGSTAYVRGCARPTATGSRCTSTRTWSAPRTRATSCYDGDDSDTVGDAPGPAGSAALERKLVESLAAAGVPASGTDFDGRSDYGPSSRPVSRSGGLFTGADEPKSAEQAQRWGGEADQPFDPCYHQACDRIDTVDRAALDRNADAAAAALARFALSTEELG